MKLFKDNSANISMDFLTAISILLITVIYAVSALPTFFTSYTSENNYQHLDSTLSVLLSPNNENGFALSHSSIIDGDKVAELYITHENNLNWYELSDTQSFRTLGFQKYHYYSQISPLDTTKYDVIIAEENAKSYVPEFGNIDLVVRYKTLEYTESGVFYGDELFGKYHPTKVIIIFDKNDTISFDKDIKLIFKEFIPNGNNTRIKTFVIGNYFDDTSKSLKPKAESITPDVYINGVQVNYTNQININITDTVEVILNQTALTATLSQWKDGFAFQFNFDGIEIKAGTTYYNSSIHEISEPYKISVWSW